MMLYFMYRAITGTKGEGMIRLLLYFMYRAITENEHLLSLLQTLNM